MNPRYPALLLLALLTSCSREGVIGDGGVYAYRSACPLVAIPEATGDITLFNPPEYANASAIDVTATITNMRTTCQDDAAQIISTTTFDVIALRRDAGPARQVVLPYFNAVVQAGDRIVAKKVSHVGLDFPAGSQRAQTRAQAIARVDRASATLPQETREILTRRRKAGDPDAAVDPLTNPTVRASVANATFEQLIGFQMSEAQLRYNATR